MNDLPVSIADIRNAAAAIAGAVAHTPTVYAPALSELVGAEIWLKLETLHRTGSFKERGALNKLLALSARAALRRGGRDVGRQSRPRVSPIMRSASVFRRRS